MTLIVKHSKFHEFDIAQNTFNLFKYKIND